MEQDRVKALNSDRNALEKKAGLSVITTISAHASRLMSPRH